MSRLPVPRRTVRAVRAGSLAFLVALVGLTGGPALAATSDVAPGLDAPMQPINRAGVTASKPCRDCTNSDAQDGTGQRVAERAAPEYSAPRRTMAMPMPSEDEGTLAPQLEPVVPEGIDSGSLLSLPGASITIPAVLR